ncbi:MAG: glycosyltransferase [Sedimentisphaerales bacterium]|nr:glycosyltransferase [Sedimentisphaerales bacterium]
MTDIRDAAKIDVLCFGGEDWWYHNRGHIDMQLMRRFAQKGKALYINSIVMQKLNIGQGRKFIQRFARKAKSIFNGLKKPSENFWVYSPFSLPVQHIGWAKPINELLLRSQIGCVKRRIGMDVSVVWVACPPACDMAIKMKKKKMVYQRTDRFEDFPGVDIEKVKSFDRELKTKADLTIFVNQKLYEEEAGQCKKAFYLDHGVDFEMFASPSQNTAGLSDISDIPKPIIGFIGSIDECNPDIEFLGKVADLLPHMSFVIIGREQTDCSALRARKNVRMLGQKAYELIPDYGRKFDVALLPLRQSRWAEAVNPLKLKEYLAMGKPVVSTPFPQLNDYLEIVYEAKTPESFAACIERAISEDNPELMDKRREKVKDSSWDSKAELVLNELFENKQSDKNEQAIA